MSSPQYLKGRKFEYATRDDLKEHGYDVLRMAGSHSAVDLVAIGDGEIVLVQCKLPGSEITREKWNDLFRLAEKSGAWPVFARKVEGRIRPEYRRLTSALVPHQRQGPNSVEWMPRRKP